MSGIINNIVKIKTHLFDSMLVCIKEIGKLSISGNMVYISIGEKAVFRGYRQYDVSYEEECVIYYYDIFINGKLVSLLGDDIFENFILLSDYREDRINNILDI